MGYRRILILGIGLSLACPGRAAPSEIPPDAKRTFLLRQHALNHGGDPKRGQQLFQTLRPTSCLTCHRVRGQGGDMGPDLSLIGGKFDRAHLVESILEPSRQIVEGFRTTILALTDGRLLTGIVREELADRLTIVDAAGQRQQVAKSRIEERRLSDVSLMPEGLADTLTPQQFTDLIAYLESLRDGRKPTPGEGITDPLTLPHGFTAVPIATGLTGATALEVSADGRIFVCEQTGALRVVKEGRLLPEPFVRLVVDSTWERGLLGVTVDPEFPRQPFVYMCQIAPKPYPHHRINRFTAAGDRAVAGSETILFEGDDQTQQGGSV